MFHVVEFDAGDGGEIGIVRQEWLTPRKKKAFWPPFKLSSQYNKALLNGEVPDDKWKLYSVRRLFFCSDDILIARKKLKDAEVESDVISAEENCVKKRKRKFSRRILHSSDSEDDMLASPKNLKRKDNLDNPDNIFLLPSPPVTDIPSKSGDSVTSLADTVIIDETFSPSSSFTHKSDENVDTALQKVCKHLSAMRHEILELKEVQAEVLSYLRPKDSDQTSFLLNEGLTLPCQTEEDINKLEEWLSYSSENKQNFEHFLSTVGGKRTEHVTRRILEKIFSNPLSLRYNWTGKNGKVSLKQLAVVSIIKNAVRRNATTSSSSDAEIELFLKNWFRFGKDRDGGRESRRKQE